MNLEINLVKTNAVGATAFQSLNRTRVQVNTTNDINAVLKDFILENIGEIDMHVRDKAFMAQLGNLENFDLQMLQSIKFMLATNGIDIIYYAVSEDEDAPAEVAADSVEYIAMSSVLGNAGIPFALKCIGSAKTGTMAEVYETIMANFRLFNGDMFANNPMKRQIEAINTTETLIGHTPAASSNYVNSILEYLGVKLICIYA